MKSDVITATVATLLDEERDVTNAALAGLKAEATDAARSAVADDVRRLAETSVWLFDQRRRALLASIDTWSIRRGPSLHPPR